MGIQVTISVRVMINHDPLELEFSLVSNPTMVYHGLPLFTIGVPPKLTGAKRRE